MITWKTHSNIIIARNPQPNDIYGFDLYTLDNRFIGAIIIRTPEEQKELFHELNTNRLNLKNKTVLYLGGIGAWN